MVLLGVYGTLKQGHYNHRKYLRKDPIFRGGVVLPAEMYSNGMYPMVIKTDQEHTVHIEIYRIDRNTLLTIDSLEEPYGYHRERVKIGEYEDVWIYFYSSGTIPDQFRKVKDGKFVKETEWKDKEQN